MALPMGPDGNPMGPKENECRTLMVAEPGYGCSSKADDDNFMATCMTALESGQPTAGLVGSLKPCGDKPEGDGTVPAADGANAGTLDCPDMMVPDCNGPDGTCVCVAIAPPPPAPPAAGMANSKEDQCREMLVKEANYPSSCTADDESYMRRCITDLDTGKPVADIVGTLPNCNNTVDMVIDPPTPASTTPTMATNANECHNACQT